MVRGSDTEKMNHYRRSSLPDVANADPRSSHDSGDIWSSGRSGQQDACEQGLVTETLYRTVDLFDL